MHIPCMLSAFLSLETVRLEQYLPALGQLGAQSPVDLLDMWEEDFVAIGMQRLEQNRLGEIPNLFQREPSCLSNPNLPVVIQYNGED